MEGVGWGMVRDYTGLDGTVSSSYGWVLSFSAGCPYCGRWLDFGELRHGSGFLLVLAISAFFHLGFLHALC